jgi:hypothetical protein
MHVVSRLVKQDATLRAVMVCANKSLWVTLAQPQTMSCTNAPQEPSLCPVLHSAPSVLQEVLRSVQDQVRACIAAKESTPQTQDLRGASNATRHSTLEQVPMESSKKGVLPTAWSPKNLRECRRRLRRPLQRRFLP